MVCIFGEAPKNKSNLARPDGPLRAVNEDTFFCFVCARLRFAPASGVVVEGCSGLWSPTAFRPLIATMGFAPDCPKPQHFAYVLFLFWILMIEILRAEGAWIEQRIAMQ